MVGSGLVSRLGAVVVSLIDVKVMLHISFVKGFFQIFSNHDCKTTVYAR
jgi:hypothetical protein